MIHKGYIEVDIILTSLDYSVNLQTIWSYDFTIAVVEMRFSKESIPVLSRFRSEVGPKCK